MRRIISATMAMAALAGCGQGPPQTGNAASNALGNEPVAAAGWQRATVDDGASLTFVDAQGRPQLRITCAAKSAKLLINVPGFAPIGSEERLSVGADGEVVTLVADTEGDKRLGGVTGQAPIPDELKQLLIAPMSASYGAQSAGPFPTVPDALAGPFLSACGKSLEHARAGANVPKPGTSPCLVQDGRLLDAAPVKAVGTEPFWAARIEGRCVTYSTPENQAGTRIWTKINSGPMGAIWAGAYQGKPFVLRMRPAAGCSDGMSDKVYALEVTLSVEGEERRGCAERGTVKS